MKKFFLLSFISVFIGLMSLVFCASQLYAAPPFEVQHGKLVAHACMEDLNLCYNDLDACGPLLPCQTFPGDGYDNPDAFGLSGHGPALSYTEPMPADGTFTDDNTGLMWEIKTNDGTNHDVNHTYSWTLNCCLQPLRQPDGTLFTDFVHKLNTTCDGAGVHVCETDADCVVRICGFAGYQDWRIPNVKELQSIVDYSSDPPPSSSVPGETMSDTYWSATTGALEIDWAFDVNFHTGYVRADSKNNFFYARAVRTP